MPIIYEATVAQKDGDLTRVFRFEDEARAFVREHDIGGCYWIDKVSLPDVPWLKLVVDIINADGGRYAQTRKTIEERHI